jgi:hypothetical protein
VSGQKIVRLLEIPEGKAFNWKAAAKTVGKANDDDVADAFELFRTVLDDPDAYGVRCFPHRGMNLYLVIADSWDSGDDDPTYWIDVLWEASVLDARGLELIATAVG